MSEPGERPAAVLIAGPTASGKSALALALAEATDGIVINADSCQVYAELRVISARPTPDEEARAPHLLYGHRPAGAAYSVAEWLADMAVALAEARRAARMPIVVGGTGLYFRALTAGLAAVPEIPADIRAYWRTRAIAEGPAQLHAELQRRDPAMAARLRPSDPQRVARALEVIAATGRSLLAWQGEMQTPPLVAPETAICRVIEPPRPLLHERIDRRFLAMIDAGALGEAREFAALALDPALPAMRAIGVRPLVDLVAGRCDRATAIFRGQAESRQYAKRQSTWFRNQMPHWPRLDPSAGGIPDMVADIREEL